MKDIETLKAILERHKEELKERYHVKELGIFGSYVRGEAGEGSDIDILVEFDVVPGLLKFIELEEYLSELLGIKVDLVRKKSVREELKDSILEEVVMI
jgi:predicted nucleotidyltransferase